MSNPHKDPTNRAFGIPIPEDGDLLPWVEGTGCWAPEDQNDEVAEIDSGPTAAPALSTDQQFSILTETIDDLAQLVKDRLLAGLASLVRPSCNGAPAGSNGDTEDQGAQERTPPSIAEVLYGRHSQPQRLANIAVNAYALLGSGGITGDRHDDPNVAAFATRHFDLLVAGYNFARRKLRHGRDNCPFSETVVAALHVVLTLRGGDLAEPFVCATLFGEGADPYRQAVHRKLSLLASESREPKYAGAPREPSDPELARRDAMGVVITAWNCEHYDVPPKFVYYLDTETLPEIVCRT